MRETNLIAANTCTGWGRIDSFGSDSAMSTSNRNARGRTGLCVLSS
jgi:homoaconitase/3-isopropylmalate dehydratase large subunit